MAIDTPGVIDTAVEARRALQRAQTDAVRAVFRHDLDLAYGDHPRQVLDMYYPPPATNAAPVLVFLHGGGFRRSGPGFVGFNGQPYLERGGMFVSMGYRFIPDVRFPDTCEDVELGLRWLGDRIAERGGDPERIYLAGHSAGAMLAAMVGLRESSVKIQGLVLIAGQYDLSTHAEDIVNRTSPRYVAKLADAIQRVPPHTILVGGDNDLPAVLPDAQSLMAAIQGHGGSAELFVEPDADHYAANRSFAASDGQVARAVRRMMRLD
jgi:arylformamidase